MNIAELLKLPVQSTILVNKVISPKGVKSLGENGEYTYRLRTELSQVFKAGELVCGCTELTDGLYWVCGVLQWANKHHWNNYLIIVDENNLRPIFQAVDTQEGKYGNTEWLLEAMPYVKKYFRGESSQVVDLVRYKSKPKAKKQKS